MRNYDFDAMVSRLKAAKSKKNITNEELSQISKVPPGTVNRILARKASEANLSTICRLSDALDLNLHYIIYGVEENANGPLTISETTLIKKFRLLDERGKRTVEGVLDMEYQQLVNSKELQDATTINDEEYSKELTPLHKQDFTSTEFVRSVVDEQEALDEKHGKGGNAVKSG